MAYKIINLNEAPKDRPILLVDDGSFYGLTKTNFIALACWVKSDLYASGGYWTFLHNDTLPSKPLGFIEIEDAIIFQKGKSW